MCQIALYKSTKKKVLIKKKFRKCAIFLLTGWVIFLTTVHTVTALTTVFFYFFFCTFAMLPKVSEFRINSEFGPMH